MRCDAPNLSEMKGGESETKCQAGRKLEGVHVLVVLAQNLFYNCCLFYTNPSFETSIENYCENK